MMTDQIQLNTLLQHSFFFFFFLIFFSRYDWHAVSFDVLLCHALRYIFLTWGHCHVLGTSHERKAIVWIFFFLLGYLGVSQGTRGVLYHGLQSFLFLTTVLLGWTPHAYSSVCLFLYLTSRSAGPRTILPPESPFPLFCFPFPILMGWRFSY